MADVKYNLSQLFKAAFGINSPVYITESLQRRQNNEFDYSGFETLPEYYPKEANSWMGTPIIGLLRFKGGEFKKYNTQGELIDYVIGETFFPPTTMFTFFRAKKMTLTELLGSNGSVKEIFGLHDWSIDVKGLCLDTPGSSAREKMNSLLEWEQIVSSINVSGKLFTQKNINSIVMEEFKEESVQGSPDVIPFTMRLISDEPIELFLPSTDRQGV
jgi:hypothetical protein